MSRYFRTPEDARLVYYGNSDLLGQIALELANRPNSCLSKNLVSWYNSLYNELSEFSDCRYQIEINEELCPDLSDSTIEEVFDLLITFSLDDAASFVVAYVVNKALEQGEVEGRQVISDIRKQLTSEFNDAK